VTSHLATSTATTTPAVTNGTRVLQFLLAICPGWPRIVLSYRSFLIVQPMSSPPSAARTQRLNQRRFRLVPGRAVAGIRTLLLCLLLTIAVLVCYNPVVHNGFLNYDDDQYITNNAHVRAGLTGATVKWAFTAYDKANWHPLTWLSHALDFELFGLNPAGHHYGTSCSTRSTLSFFFCCCRARRGFAGAA